MASKSTTVPTKKSATVKSDSKAAAKPAASPRGLAINIGISDKDRAAIAQGLSHLLADTYTLYLTTHNFHWNVTGPMFNTLHTMFMAQHFCLHMMRVWAMSSLRRVAWRLNPPLMYANPVR